MFVPRFRRFTPIAARNESISIVGPACEPSLVCQSLKAREAWQAGEAHRAMREARREISRSQNEAMGDARQAAAEARQAAREACATYHWQWL
jgi:hypothetical protein